MIEHRDTPLVAALCPSPCFEPRRSGAKIDILLLHYTGMQSCERAIWWLSQPQSRVSCHYVVDVDGRITQMVAERERAWHAGEAFWQGERDINSRSIGIEIHNPGHDAGYPSFPEAQMAALERLCLDIAGRHAIPAERVLAHSDVAPSRKIDPGEKFDWRRLAARGIGHWVEPEALTDTDFGYDPGASVAEVADAQRLLRAYGYQIDPTGRLDAATATVLAAFQRHFRQARVDGRLDRSTLATLQRLTAALEHKRPPPFTS